MKNKFAFTLAEVLITLVIIGVVAALTIPNIIYETKKKEYSARLKKFYSVMKQAELKSNADGKPWGDFVNANVNVTGNTVIKSFINEYILPYISYVKTEGNNVYLSDGSDFRVGKGQNCFQFYVDLNGNKNPNEKGSDIQTFEYCQQNYSGKKLTLVPYQSSSNFESRESALSACIALKEACTALLMFDNWEFKDDYPYRL